MPGNSGNAAISYRLRVGLARLQRADLPAPASPTPTAAGDAHLTALRMARLAALERLHRVAREVEQHTEQLVGTGVDGEPALDRADPADLRCAGAGPIKPERLAHVLDQRLE